MNTLEFTAFAVGMIIMINEIKKVAVRYYLKKLKKQNAIKE